MQTDSRKPGRRCAPEAAVCRHVAVLASLLVSLSAPLASAVEVTSLYTVEVPYDAQSANARDEAYRAALTEVLVRVTGTTAVAESEQLAQLFPDPARYVLRFQPGQDGTLIVSLAGPAIERILRQSGAPVWGSERPLTLVWLAIDWGNGEREMVAADNPVRFPANARALDRNKLLRDRVVHAATRRGVPVVFPLLDTEDLEQIGFSDVWGGFDDVLLAASARYQASSVLVGRFRPDSDQAIRWTWYFDNRRQNWLGEPELAVDTLADSLAAALVPRGNAPLETIELTITGIDSVAAYGRVQQYMENLRNADRVAVRGAAGDRISYEIDMRGGVARLNDELSRSGLLERVNGGFAIDSRNLGRYSPGPDRPPAAGEGPAAGGTRAVEYLYRPLPQPPAAPRPAPGAETNPGP